MIPKNRDISGIYSPLKCYLCERQDEQRGGQRNFYKRKPDEPNRTKLGRIAALPVSSSAWLELTPFRQGLIFPPTHPGQSDDGPIEDGGSEDPQLLDNAMPSLEEGG